MNEGPNVVISRRTPKIKDNGKVPVRLELPGRADGPLRGHASARALREQPGVAEDLQHRPGTSLKVSARLSRGDRRKLSRSGEITARATSIEQGQFGDKTTVQTLELTAGKRHT